MAAAMSAEQYLGTAQHAVLARLSQALANVPATQPKDKQLAGVAGMLGLPAPRVGGHELFEETLSRLVLDYASTAMTQARVEARAVHAGETTWTTSADRINTHLHACHMDTCIIVDDDTPDATTDLEEPLFKKQLNSYGQLWTIGNTVTPNHQRLAAAIPEHSSKRSPRKSEGQPWCITFQEQFKKHWADNNFNDLHGFVTTFKDTYIASPADTCYSITELCYVTSKLINKHGSVKVPDGKRSTIIKIAFAKTGDVPFTRQMLEDNIGLLGSWCPL